KQRVRAVAADVVEGAQLPILPAHDEDALIGNRACEIVARLRQVARMALENPAAIEDRLMLGAIDRRIEIPFGRQGEGTLRGRIEASGIEGRRRAETRVHGPPPADAPQDPISASCTNFWKKWTWCSLNSLWLRSTTKRPWL